MFSPLVTANPLLVSEIFRKVRNCEWILILDRELHAPSVRLQSSDYELDRDLQRTPVRPAWIDVLGGY